jgi:hypothetical protein
MFGIFDSVQKVVYNGLELYFDAAQKVSYPGSGSVWNDIAKGNTANLTSTYTFYSDNGGYLADFSPFSTTAPITMSAITNLPGVTFQAVVMFTEGQYSGPKLLASNNSGGQNFGLEIETDLVRMVSDGGGRQASTSITRNAWIFVSGVRDVANLSMSIRINNGSRITNTYASMSNVAIESPWMISRDRTSSVQFRGRIAAVLAYSRALTSDEELQNFYALRQRYGI